MAGLLRLVPRMLPRRLGLCSRPAVGAAPLARSGCPTVSPLLPLAAHRHLCSHAIDAFLDPYEVDPNLPPPGRSWRAPEIRLKSNADLQKLWIVLLRERNMLASVKMLHKSRKTTMPYKDRIKKVKVSMAIIKTVLAEREREAQQRRRVLTQGTGIAADSEPQRGPPGEGETTSSPGETTSASGEPSESLGAREDDRAKTHRHQ